MPDVRRHGAPSRPRRPTPRKTPWTPAERPGGACRLGPPGDLADATSDVADTPRSNALAYPRPAMGASAADPSQARPPLPEPGEPEPAADDPESAPPPRPAAHEPAEPTDSAEPGSAARPSRILGDTGAHLGEVIANRFRLVA